MGEHRGQKRLGEPSAAMLSLALSEHEREGKLGENILDHHAVLTKLSKTDGESLKQNCWSVELPISQEQSALNFLLHMVKEGSSLWEVCPLLDVVMDFRAQENRL